MSFEEAYEEFKIYASKRHKKQGFDTLTQNFNKHILPYFKNKDMCDLKIQDFIYWQDKIIDFNFSNNYNRNIYQSFKLFIKYCLLNSYLNVDYVELIGSFPKKIELKKHNVYSKRDFIRFRRGLHDKVYLYFFDLLFYYGLRSGEAMALKFSNLRGRYLHVGTNISRRGKREIDTPKTLNSNRVLCLSFSMRFKLFLLKCMYEKKFCCSDYDYYIFGGKKPLSPTSVNRYKHNACKEVNIREITVHEFRHSYATRMIRKKPVDIVSRSLGHSSVSITIDFYVHNEKREFCSLFSRFDFFNTLTQNFKKIFKYIITLFVV